MRGSAHILMTGSRGQTNELFAWLSEGANATTPLGVQPWGLLRQAYEPVRRAVDAQPQLTLCRSSVNSGSNGACSRETRNSGLLMRVGRFRTLL